MKIFIVRPCLRGGEDKSLIRRHREDDRRNRTLDLFVPGIGKGKKPGDAPYLPAQMESITLHLSVCA